MKLASSVRNIARIAGGYTNPALNESPKHLTFKNPTKPEFLKLYIKKEASRDYVLMPYHF